MPADSDRRLIVACDGACRGNPGPAAIGALVTDESGRVLAEIAEGIGETTNNVAEYRACIAGLRRARELGATDVLVRADSHLMVEQAAGRYKVKNPGLQVLHRELLALAREFPGSVSFEHVRREFNKAADKLANKGLDDWLARESAGS